MNAELERLLVELAQQHAPQLVENGHKPNRQTLARELANHSILAITGYPEAHYAKDPPKVVGLCVNYYKALYHLLIDALFPPALKKIEAYYQVYDQSKLLVHFKAEARPVIQVFAGYVSPYVAERQAAKSVSDYEILALVDVVLHNLDADDLEQTRYEEVRLQGAKIVKRLLGMPLRQQPLTAFDTPFFSKIEQAPPPLPPDLPEASQHVGPFSNGTLTLDPTEELSFLQDLDSAVLHEPEEKLPPLRDHDEHTPETGKQPSTAKQPAQSKQGKKKSGRTGQLRSPLPYWDDDSE
ncbi:MAG: hypothetical protein K8L99_12535 [Anaerolineae bacterium]|nr:hypothetical protein [Anaerolineae bacterium]